MRRFPIHFRVQSSALGAALLVSAQLSGTRELHRRTQKPPDIAPHLHVELLVPGKRRSIPAATSDERGRPLLQAGAGLACLLAESGRLGRAAANQVDAAERCHRRSAGVSGARAPAAGSADGLRLRERSAVSRSAFDLSAGKLTPGSTVRSHAQGQLAGLPRGLHSGQSRAGMSEVGCPIARAER